ncbi:MAG TPA: phosphomannomutase/phosphoglucomutase [Longimicrobiales bacterium]|nr:phosphomannomutase/phosphoglucomutase [Longimicrobiales bacterium]
MAINEHIFREYDIRGIVARDLTGEVPRLIGRALGSELRARLGSAGDERLTVVVGQDNRPSSPALAADAIAGLRETGVDVVFIETVPTPVLYFAFAHYEADGALQITGSHNPPEYNGFKMVARDGSIYGDAIQRMRARIESGDFATGQGSLTERDVKAAYIDETAGKFRLERPVRVVVDCGNGAGSLVAVELLERIGAEVIPLYCESDGTFPNHHPDPVVDENLADLIDLVRSEKAELGIAFDGDADRIGAVDELGQIVRGDILLLLFGLDVLEEHGPGTELIFDVKCTQALPEVFAAAGGKPVMWKTGHSLIKERMKQTGAPVAGELSGHICFADANYFDDALYAACRLTAMLGRSAESLSRRTAAFPQYVSTPELRVEVPEEKKFDIVARAIEEFSRDHEVVDVDGARVLFDGGWGLLRASNTQPVLVLRYEARDSARLAHIRETFEAWLRGQGVQPDA